MRQHAYDAKYVMPDGSPHRLGLQQVRRKRRRLPRCLIEVVGFDAARTARAWGVEGRTWYAAARPADRVSIAGTVRQP
jgi:hypothetical protein